MLAWREGLHTKLGMCFWGQRQHATIHTQHAFCTWLFRDRKHIRQQKIFDTQRQNEQKGHSCLWLERYFTFLLVYSSLLCAFSSCSAHDLEGERGGEKNISFKEKLGQVDTNRRVWARNIRTFVDLHVLTHALSKQNLHTKSSLQNNHHKLCRENMAQNDQKTALRKKAKGNFEDNRTLSESGASCSLLTRVRPELPPCPARRQNYRIS
jgi:hypothetical protein